MGKRHYGVSVDVNAGTEHSDIIPVRQERVSLVVNVGAGDPVDVVLQGKVRGPSERWESTALSADGLADQGGQIVPAAGGDGTIFAVFTEYRLQVTSTGQNSVYAELIGLD